tara:strand:+ start:71 stop:1285 length:1215 start_codon:yes stop_codon:yes gene_type:complete
MLLVDNNDNVFDGNVQINNVLNTMGPLTTHSDLNFDEFIRAAHQDSTPQSTYSEPSVPTECNSEQAVSPFRLPSTGSNANETSAEKEGMQAVLSAASAVIQMSSASQDGQPFAQQEAVRTVLSAASAYNARLTAQKKGRLKVKKVVGNAGYLAQHVGGKNKMNGSVKHPTNNLEKGSCGRRAISKLATELVAHCDGEFSFDKFDITYFLDFRKWSQTESLFQELAKKAGAWSKIVKFCMLVDGHGDKDCSGAPSKALRSFSLVFNGAYTDGIQTVVSPFKTIEALHLYDLESDSDGRFKDFINKMAIELAKKVGGSIKLEQKIKNIDKDLRKCVKDIKLYTQRDKINAMWTTWQESAELDSKLGVMPSDDSVIASMLQDDNSEEEFEMPEEAGEAGEAEEAEEK